MGVLSALLTGGTCLTVVVMLNIVCDLPRTQGELLPLAAAVDDGGELHVSIQKGSLGGSGSDILLAREAADRHKMVNPLVNARKVNPVINARKENPGRKRRMTKGKNGNDVLDGGHRSIYPNPSDGVVIIGILDNRKKRDMQGKPMIIRRLLADLPRHGRRRGQH